MNNAVPVIAEVRFPDLRGGYGKGEEAARVSGSSVRHFLVLSIKEYHEHIGLLKVGKVAPKRGVGSGGTGNNA